MTDIRACIILYSETNPWINFAFVIEPHCDFSKAEDIIVRKYDEWWKQDKAQNVPILDWIGNALTDADVEFTVYCSNNGNDEEVE